MLAALLAGFVRLVTILLGLLGGLALSATRSWADSPPMDRVSIRVSAAPRCLRTIDGFGTTAPHKLASEPWLQKLYFQDLGASVLRVDLTPRFRSPVSDVAYSSPWFHGQPPLPGPEGNNVRTYRDLADYTREWSGRRAAIAVLGPDIEHNLRQFDFASAPVAGVGSLARAGQRASQAEPPKLVGSIWSPAPWLKHSSGGRFEGEGDVMPKNGTPWPFIWAGNFAGGQLDTSGQPRAELDDGTGPTSALTQFVRITAAYVLGFQRAFGVRFYALSLQNELNFETFYNSCSYPLASAYVTTLKALRKELDRHAELRAIQLIGPEDLVDADAYALWQYGAGPGAVHKNLQYLAAIAADPEARAALSFFAVHAYARDGVHGSGEDDTMWRWWVEGWSTAPAAGLPSTALGTRAYRKKSWMTESSGEASVWLPRAGRPLSDSALGLALKIQRALTVGEESAWLYWQLLDGKPVGGETLTDASLRERAPKYVAYKHFARFVRPGSCLLESSIEARLDKLGDLHVSAYRHARHGSTMVLINSGEQARPVEIDDPALGSGALEVYTSDAATLWQKQTARSRAGALRLLLPPHSVSTLHGPAPQAARK
ncbi:MAG: hypothetical protein JWN48_5233 [Myxococcaceae bacterium]|nr:hypothetical protein [Myxococcaceae bacterium]